MLPGSTGLPMKVLFVEDYKPLQKAVAQAIREIGWVIDVTGDGEDGWWHCDTHVYDVIVLDLMLPKVNGLEILRRFREKGDRTPVLILTARDVFADRMAEVSGLGGGDGCRSQDGAFPCGPAEIFGRFAS